MHTELHFSCDLSLYLFIYFFVCVSYVSLEYDKEFCSDWEVSIGSDSDFDPEKVLEF